MITASALMHQRERRKRSPRRLVSRKETNGMRIPKSQVMKCHNHWYNQSSSLQHAHFEVGKEEKKNKKNPDKAESFLQELTPPKREDLPQAISACMFQPISPTYDEDFPPVQEYLDGQNKHRHLPKVSNLTGKDEVGNPKMISPTETELNWQLKIFLAKTATSKRLGHSLEMLTSKVEQVDSKVEKHHQENQALLKVLHKRLKEIQEELPTSQFSTTWSKKKFKSTNCKTKLLPSPQDKHPYPVSQPDLILPSSFERTISSPKPRTSIFSPPQEKKGQVWQNSET